MNFWCQDIVLSINGSVDEAAVEWQALLCTVSNINDTICYTLGRVDIWTALCIIHISGGVLLAKEATQVVIKVEPSQGMAPLPERVLHFRVGHTGLRINKVATSGRGSSVVSRLVSLMRVMKAFLSENKMNGRALFFFGVRCFQTCLAFDTFEFRIFNIMPCIENRKTK